MQHAEQRLQALLEYRSYRLLPATATTAPPRPLERRSTNDAIGQRNRRPAAAAAASTALAAAAAAPTLSSTKEGGE